MFEKLMGFLFPRKVNSAQRAKGAVTVEMKVTRADGIIEKYVKDSKGQRRIS